jgi:hypothetical protein
MTPQTLRHMSTDPDRQAKGKRIMAEIVAIPAILAFRLRSMRNSIRFASCAGLRITSLSVKRCGVRKATG